MHVPRYVVISRPCPQRCELGAGSIGSAGTAHDIGGVSVGVLRGWESLLVFEPSLVGVRVLFMDIGFIICVGLSVA